MRKNWLSSVLVLLAAGVSAADAPAVIMMGECRQFPHAGIALAVPNGFEVQPLSEPFDVMRAVLTESDKPVRAVTLTAIPVGEKQTADAFADAQLAELKKSLVVRRLKVHSKTKLPVGSIEGTAWLMSYEFRGIETIAARVYFTRDLPKAEARICYMLTVEAPADRQATVLPTLGEVIKTVTLTAVRHPWKAKPTGAGNVIEDYKRGYTLRVPHGWFAGLSHGGMELGLTDYLLGGEPNPMVMVLVDDVSAETTGRSCAKRAIQAARNAYAQQDVAIKVLSEGPAKLAGMDAYQFTLQQVPRSPAGTQLASAPAADAKDTAVTFVHRIACRHAAEGKKAKSFSLIVACKDAPPATAEAIMNRLADGFKLLAPTTQATTTTLRSSDAAPLRSTRATAPAVKK